MSFHEIHDDPELEALRLQALRSVGTPTSVEERIAYENQIMLNQIGGDGANDPTFKPVTDEELELLRDLTHRSILTEAAAARDREAGDIASKWVLEHPEYAAIPQNGELMQMQLAQLELEPSPENLDAAWQALQEKGLATFNKEAVAEIEKQAKAEVIRRRAVGIADRIVGGSPSTKRSARHVDDPEDSSKLSLDELRRRAIEGANRGEW